MHRPIVSQLPSSVWEMSTDAYDQVLLSVVQHSLGSCLFWTTRLAWLKAMTMATWINRSPSLQSSPRTQPSPYIARAKSPDPFYLYSRYASSSWRLHLVCLFFFTLFLLLFFYLFKIPITLDCFSRSHTAVQPHGSNMFRDFSSPPHPLFPTSTSKRTYTYKNDVNSLFISGTVF